MPTRGSKVQRRHCCAARKTQPMPPGCTIGTRGGCWGDGGCRNIKELVRSGEYNACLKFKAWEVTQFWKKYVECKPDRNRPADLAWNRKPGRNQTADLTRNRKPDRSKPSFSGTVHFQPRCCENHNREPSEPVVVGNRNHLYRTKKVYVKSPRFDWLFGKRRGVSR